MCGIAGIYEFARAVDPDELDRFTDSLAHRGPDGRGSFIDGNLGLGHRRLAIFDLSHAGRCPMRYIAPDGKTLWITYNGEIYNFLELRSELAARGYRFATETDTEVILAAYHFWGKECLFKFNGMWAFAIWDPQKRELYLSRDRFGIKPVYYARTAGRFLFASELKSFLFLDAFGPELNPEAVTSTLRYPTKFEGMTAETLLKNIAKLPGGHELTVSASGQIIESRWWDSASHRVAVDDSYEHQVETFKELFFDSVRLRLRSDVRIGTSLSGGLDSSAVVCAMHSILKTPSQDQRLQNDCQTAFIASFPGTLQDETPFAAAVAAATGITPYYWQPSTKISEEELVRSVYYGDDVVGTALVPMMCVYEQMRRMGVFVTLDGHGGDELLAGYSGYFNWKAGDLKQKLYDDLHSTMLPSILRNFDRSSMRHGVEVRCPLLDYRLVTFILSLEWTSLIGAGFTKRILRDAMRGLMPETVRIRQNKIGFNSTLHTWYNSHLQKFILKTLDDPLFLTSPFWNGKELRERYFCKTRDSLWTNTLEDFREANRLWVILNYLLWHRLFIDRSLPVST